MQLGPPAAVPYLSPNAPSPTSDLLPTPIIPHLFVGNEGHTNRDTINRLNIKYILSLGHLPIISKSNSPTSPTTNTTTTTTNGHTNGHNINTKYHNNQQILMPSQNSSKDFKIGIRASNDQLTPSKRATANSATAANNNPTSIININPTTPTVTSHIYRQNHHHNHHQQQHLHNHQNSRSRDENKGVCKTIRSIHCKCINVADNSGQIIMKFFDEAYAFIDEARRKKCNVLVHCLAGISRSPTFTIAYLMRVKSLHWRDAYYLVKKCRPQIEPNIGFICELETYNKSLREQKLSDMDQDKNTTTITTTTTNDTTTNTITNKLSLTTTS